MGIIANAVNNAVEWIIGRILRPLVQSIVGKLNDIAVSLRVAAYKASRWLAIKLQNDYFFLASLVVIVAAALLMPKIIAGIKKLGVAINIASIVAQIQLGLVRLIDPMVLILADTINKLLKVFWPQYRSMMNSLAEAISGLAGVFGEGSGYIHAYLSGLHGIIFSVNSMLRLPPENALIEFYTDASNYWKDLDEKIEYYAYNPGAIVTSLIEDVWIPRAEQLSTLNESVFSDIRGAYEETARITDDIEAVKLSIDVFVDGLPEQIREQFNLRWEPISIAFDESIAFFREEILSRIEETVVILEEFQDRVAAMNESVQEKLDRPDIMLMKAEYLDEVDRALMIEYLAGLNMEWTEAEGVAVAEAFETASDVLSEEDRSLVEAQMISPALFYELYPPKGFKPTIKTVIKSWFVGEY